MKYYTLKLNGKYYAGEDPERDEVAGAHTGALGPGFHNHSGRTPFQALVWTDEPQHLLGGDINLKSAVHRVLDRARAGLYAGQPLHIEISEVKDV
jgi:hypothetical protein